ncbi:Aste57867_5030 [Aphanomyces stellatus]|uniref:pyridoxal kinase n=1 Tax=Aphanomyces stellatus TaxID=120398 RepID=A0A485KG95_9STRA|nr:hypothetical protein As57867_005017 [Aphanomyces stellatus]VFT82111.1 Aste57867_5030 [Aphanomyces stellatus]
MLTLIFVQNIPNFEPTRAENFRTILIDLIKGKAASSIPENWMAEETNFARVLSIQSHVVHGYVGNRSAVFPMQLLGLEVDVLNTVHFSNHTGYKKFRGQRMDGEQLLDIVAGLEENDLLHYSHLLTGYVGNPSLLRAITTTLAKLRDQNPSLIYVCDPVMGDDNKLYVAPELGASSSVPSVIPTRRLTLVDIYRDEVLPFADIITPNQFECELLSGMPLTGDADFIAASLKLHALGPRIVVVSSFVSSPDAPTLWLYASERHAESGLSNQYKMEIPRLQAYYSGTGDLFAALLLAWLTKYPYNLKHVLENIVATIQAVMKRTNDAQSANRELRLVQSRRDIESPTIAIRVQLLHCPITHVFVDTRLVTADRADVTAALTAAGVTVIPLIHTASTVTSTRFDGVANAVTATSSPTGGDVSWLDTCAALGVLPVNALFLTEAAPVQEADAIAEFNVAGDLASALALVATRNHKA